MTFKPAKCSNCGGALQVPDDRATVKCMYCGVDVIVREAIQLAAGRVKEFTPATPITKPEGISSCSVLLLVLGGSFVLFGLLALKDMEGGVAVIFIGLALCFLIPSIARLKRRNEIKEIGIKGTCPYCESPLNIYHVLGVKSAGIDCDACKKRVVIRDNKFFSVDTPVSGIKRTEQ